MSRVLFVCGKARMRSPTGADIVAGWDGFQADFAGLSNDADEKLSSEHVKWADVICVMEQRQRKRIVLLFGPILGAKRIVVLGVPDRYSYMDPDLVSLLTPKLRSILGCH
jgi:predicted protein tyrosine phosphatase